MYFFKCLFCRLQITDLLTTEELVLTFPSRLLKPRTFKLKPESSIFIGGLARLDFLEGSEGVLFTVFCAETLPITITKLNDADYIYDNFLGTKLLAVPIGDSQRLKLFPALKSGKIIECTGIDAECSCIDVVLSNAGMFTFFDNYIFKLELLRLDCGDPWK